MILLRTTAITDKVVAFGQLLQRASNLEVMLVADERFATPCLHLPWTAISREGLRAMGLYCPDYFRWRCGDYALYWALQECGPRPYYWMIEYDVRFSAMGLEEFFAFFESHNSDFLTAGLCEATSDWHWYNFARARNIQAYRCLFPVTRFSRAAIEALFAKRQEHSQQLRRRIIWPNDEVFATTTLKSQGFSVQDFNDFGTEYYDDESFGFYTPIEGEQLEHKLISDGLFRIYHPVLFGEEYTAKLTKLEGYKRKDPHLKKAVNYLKAFPNNFYDW